MKVIANIDNNRVLCEVSIQELAYLNGFRAYYEAGFDKKTVTTVGYECDITKMVATSQFVRGIRKDSLAKAVEKIEEILVGLEEAQDVITEMEAFSILKDEKLVGDKD